MARRTPIVRAVYFAREQAYVLPDGPTARRPATNEDLFVGTPVRAGVRGF